MCVAFMCPIVDDIRVDASLSVVIGKRLGFRAWYSARPAKVWPAIVVPFLSVWSGTGSARECCLRVRRRRRTCRVWIIEGRMFLAIR
jgi:hypothetical protein